jgi:hypothetical protein
MIFAKKSASREEEGRPGKPAKQPLILYTSGQPGYAASHSEIISLKLL